MRVSSKMTCSPHNYLTIGGGRVQLLDRHGRPAGRANPGCWPRIGPVRGCWPGIWKPEDVSASPTGSSSRGLVAAAGATWAKRSNHPNPKSRWEVSGNVNINCLGCHASPERSAAVRMFPQELPVGGGTRPRHGLAVVRNIASKLPRTLDPFYKKMGFGYPSNIQAPRDRLQPPSSTPNGSCSLTLRSARPIFAAPPPRRHERGHGVAPAETAMCTWKPACPAPTATGTASTITSSCPPVRRRSRRVHGAVLQRLPSQQDEGFSGGPPDGCAASDAQKHPAGAPRKAVLHGVPLAVRQVRARARGRRVRPAGRPWRRQMGHGAPVHPGAGLCPR